MSLMSTVVGFFFISLSQPTTPISNYTQYAFYPWIYGPIFVQAFDFFFSPFILPFTHTYTHFSTDWQQKIMFYLNIQLLCIKTYDYFLFDISILDSLTETRGKRSLIYRLILNILWPLLLLLVAMFLRAFLLRSPASMLISFWLSVYCF